MVTAQAPQHRAAAPEAALGVGSVFGLPFESGTFDGVVANFVVNHVGGPRAAITDFMRVSVPNGVVGVTVWPSDPPSAINAQWADVVKATGALRPPHNSHEQCPEVFCPTC